MIVDNKPGAGGTLGSNEASKAAPDGYTLLLATTSTHSIAPSLYKNIPYSVEKDLAPISELVMTSTKRTPLLPNVPTLIESGLPGYEVNTYFGLFAPPGTPREILQRLQREAAAAVQSAEVKESFASQGAEPVGGTPEALSALIRTETAKWKRVIEPGQIKVE